MQLMHLVRLEQFSKPFQCSFSADVVKLFDEAWGEIEGDCPLYFRWFGYQRFIGYIKQVWVCFALKIFSNNLRMPFVIVKVEWLIWNVQREKSNVSEFNADAQDVCLTFKNLSWSTYYHAIQYNPFTPRTSVELNEVKRRGIFVKTKFCYFFLVVCWNCVVNWTRNIAYFFRDRSIEYVVTG